MHINYDFKLDFSENKAARKRDCYRVHVVDEKDRGTAKLSGFPKVAQLAKRQGRESNSPVVTAVENLLALFSLFSL